MAFIASKYEGGINVNEVDILAPLFAGGGEKATMLDPSEYVYMQGLQGQATEGSIILNRKLTELKQVTETYKNNPTAEGFAIIGGLQKEIASIRVHEQTLKNNQATFDKTKDSPYNQNEAVSSNGTYYNSPLETIIHGLYGDPNADLYGRGYNIGQINDKTANRMSLFNQDGDVNIYNPDPIFSDKNLGVSKYIEDKYESSKGSFKVERSNTDPKVDAYNNPISTSTNKYGFTTNYVALATVTDNMIKDINNDPVLYQTAMTDAARALKDSYYDGVYYMPTAIKTSPDGANGSVQQLATAYKGKNIVNLLVQYTANGSIEYYELSNKDNTSDAVNVTKNIEAYTSFKYAREDIENQKLLAIYLGNDKGFNEITDERSMVDYLRNALYESTTDKNMKAKYEQLSPSEVLSTATEMGKATFKKTTDLYIRQTTQEKENAYKNQEAMRDNAQTIYKKSDAEREKDELNNNLFSAVIANGKYRNFFHIQHGGADGKYGIYEQNIISYTIQPKTVQTIWGVDLYTNLEKNNNAIVNGARVGVVVSGGVGLINLANPVAGSTAKDVAGYGNTFVMFSDAAGNSFAVPYSFSESSANVVKINNEMLQGLNMDNDKWMATATDPLNWNNWKSTQNPSGEQAGTLANYGVLTVNMPFEEMWNMKTVISKEELMSNYKNDIKLNIGNYNYEYPELTNIQIFNNVFSSSWLSKQWAASDVSSLGGKENYEFMSAWILENTKKGDSAQTAWNAYKEFIDDEVISQYKFAKKDDGNFYTELSYKELFQDDEKAFMRTFGYSDRNPNGFHVIDDDGEIEIDKELERTRTAKESTSYKNSIILVPVAAQVQDGQIFQNLPPVQQKQYTAHVNDLKNKAENTATKKTYPK